MPSPAQQVPTMLGLNSTERTNFAQRLMMRDPITDPMVRYVHERVVRWRERRENHSLNSAIDDAHRIIKRAAKRTGIGHAHFLSALADKFLDNPADSEGAGWLSRAGGITTQHSRAMRRSVARPQARTMRRLGL
jgi:hypothetical protein